MYRWIPLVALTVCLGACDGSTRTDADDRAPALDEAAVDALEAELIDADREFARTASRTGLGAWMENIAPAGRVIAGGESYIGQEGVRRAMLPIYADSTYTLTWDPTYAEVAASGDLGYTVGRYEATWKVNDTDRQASGTYLTVWRRQPNGRWKVKADIGNPDETGN